MLSELRDNPRVKWLLIGGGILIALVLVISFVRVQLQNRALQAQYEEGMQFVRNEEYDKARSVFNSMTDYRDAAVLRNYALARAEMESGDIGQAEIMLETIPLDYEGDMSEEIMAYKRRGFEEDVKEWQSTMEWLEQLNEEGNEGEGEGSAGEGDGASDDGGSGENVTEGTYIPPEEEEMVDVPVGGSPTQPQAPSGSSSPPSSGSAESSASSPEERITYEQFGEGNNN